MIEIDRNKSAYSLRLLDKELSLFSDKIRSMRQHETVLFVPNVENFELSRRELDVLKNKVNSITANDKVTELIQSHFRDFLDGQSLFLNNLYERPAEHVNLFLDTFRNIARYDSRPDTEKCKILIERFRQAGRIWNGMLPWLNNVSEMYLKELIDYCNLFIRVMMEESKRIQAYFPGLNERQQHEVIDIIQKLSGKMGDWIEQAGLIALSKESSRQLKGGESDILKFDEPYYRLLLNNYGIGLDELLSWHEDEVENTRNEIFEIAGKLKITDPMSKNMRDVNNILFKYAGPSDSPKEMYEKAAKYMNRARLVCHEYLTMPDDETCIIGDTPEQYKFSWPWGGYGDGCPKRRPLTGEYFLNSSNYKAVTDGWSKMMSLHEVYPGHHAQFVRRTLDTIPETMKIGAKGIPLLEGTAHRSERAFEFVFEEDQFYPLFVAYRRHHTSVRIKADLWLRFYGRPIQDVVQLYVDELDFDRKSARGQVKQQEEMQGYFTNYYYGMKKLEDWEIQYGYDKKGFTEILFSLGMVSLSNVERFLKLNDTEKKSLLSDYGSLLQFD